MFLPPDEPSGLDRRAARLAGAVAGAHALRRGGATRRAHARGGVRHGRLEPRAPVLAASFGATSLTALDSTDPAAVLAIERAGIGDAVFVVSSKSGTTVETLAFYHYFTARARPEQFVAITEPGTSLETLARERGIRAVFPHPVDVGGRYAALTVVGMVPAALIGVDGRTLLERAQAVQPDRAKALGARLAAAVQARRDKLVLRHPPRIARLADWVEQLVAESTGKNGRGVVPIVDDPASERRPDALECSAIGRA